ncbi:MAG: hypothetical protein HOY71_33175 [Nonomuraea sp.]|nr:hypothetical protein [Nonomuraea sp.]
MTTRMVAVLVLASLAVGCSAAPPTVAAKPTPTASPTPSPSPTVDDTYDSCQAFSAAWMGWSPGRTVSQDMRDTLDDLAEPGSKVRKDAQRMQDALAAYKIKIEDREIRRAVDQVMLMAYLQVRSKCANLPEPG